jgi:Putative peptidoglycan binding domain
MKSLLIGTVSLAMTLPAFAGTPSVASAAGEKFGATTRLNYTAVARGAGARAGYRPGYAGYRGYPYHGGYYGGRYPYYGYRYPYYGYYGYPYAAAFAFGIPLAYAAGYYASAPYYYPNYGYGPGYGYSQGYYNGQIVAETAPGYRGSNHSSGGSVSRSVQSALASQGFYHGSVDGLFGPESQQAMAQFQQAHGLKVTGLIDSSSMKALGLH